MVVLFFSSDWLTLGVVEVELLILLGLNSGIDLDRAVRCAKSMEAKMGDFWELEIRRKVTKISKRNKEKMNGYLRCLRISCIDEDDDIIAIWD